MRSIALLAAVGLVSCDRAGDPTLPQPKKVYGDAFESPLEAVEIEAHGGTIVGSYDAWLRLRPSESVVARLEAEYRPVDCARARLYFERNLQLDGLSLAGANLSCREYTNPRLPFENGRWLVEDQLDGRVYYRIWKFR